MRQAVAHGQLFVAHARAVSRDRGGRGVESRLIRQGRRLDAAPRPVRAAALPPLTSPRGRCWCRAWICTCARAMLERFRFVPDARLDDVMVSLRATDGGGSACTSIPTTYSCCNPRHPALAHRPASDPQLQDGVPLKILTNRARIRLAAREPGDMLYLPGWARRTRRRQVPDLLDRLPPRCRRRRTRAACCSSARWTATKAGTTAASTATRSRAPMTTPG